MDVDVTVRQVDAKTVEIEGARAIDMRDFGLPPPSFLMFRMRPEVQVKAKLGRAARRLNRFERGHSARRIRGLRIR